MEVENCQNVANKLTNTPPFANKENVIYKCPMILKYAHHANTNTPLIQTKCAFKHKTKIIASLTHTSIYISYWYKQNNCQKLYDPQNPIDYLCKKM